MAKRKRRAFTKEFKAETVRLVRDSGRSAGRSRGSRISRRRRSGIGCGRPRSMPTEPARGADAGERSSRACGVRCGHCRWSATTQKGRRPYSGGLLSRESTASEQHPPE
jgi:hypothetical protein